METDNLIEIRNAVPRIHTLAFAQPINWAVTNSQHWAIVGPNGAGKTLLIDILLGKHALKSGEIISKNNISINTVVKCVAFRDIYSLVDIQNSYYQQRWNAGDEHEVPVVRDLFSKGEKEWVEMLIAAFKIEDLVEKPINLLSSGELRKTLIVRSLLSKPQILILDNPFIGLDAKSRTVLNDLLTRLSLLENLQIVLILSHPKDLPSIITHILPVKDKSLLPVISRDEFVNDLALQQSLFNQENNANISELLDNSSDQLSFENALLFKNIHIRYGTRTILKDLDWQVKRGEKWALLGENGSGKSTLLSLVSGDNPQAYANDITLFDRKRGSGESIWDIKKHIGYVSPEMHLYYQKNVRCIDVVGSGFFDTIGLYKKCSEAQAVIALEWMKIFGIDNIKDVSFLYISTGEQRLVLLARVFVKNPDLLILDEPLHGLDVANKHRIKKIIEDFCTDDKALIYVTHYEDEIPDVVTQRMVLTKRN
ncbi:ATP-binding cassette domain-containing protein [Dysgonomonas sp. HGC4]|uniref:ATP-binding cassette domain-containing protein n=1 Tax=Dysgonomonas sp. HGC4 TaxID=1658009 RepID=UPI000682D75A|nr:ATP-binding cassette domain-containing protein [Dysgonomonas sp. HGC4]MBD8346754.1 ATP-binding cassette domain-containing protein [Dysgonomonas sp. HGC4]